MAATSLDHWQQQQCENRDIQCSICEEQYTDETGEFCPMLNPCCGGQTHCRQCATKYKKCLICGKESPVSKLLVNRDRIACVSLRITAKKIDSMTSAQLRELALDREKQEVEEELQKELLPRLAAVQKAREKLVNENIQLDVCMSRDNDILLTYAAKMADIQALLEDLNEQLSSIQVQKEAQERSLVEISERTSTAREDVLDFLNRMRSNDLLIGNTDSEINALNEEIARKRGFICTSAEKSQSLAHQHPSTTATSSSVFGQFKAPSSAFGPMESIDNCKYPRPSSYPPLPKTGTPIEKHIFDAAYNNDLAKLRALCKIWAGHEVIDRPNKALDDWSAIIAVAHIGYEESLRILIAASANLETVDKNGDNALIHAAVSGNTSVCRLLLNEGASLLTLNKKNKSALQEARENGRAAVVALFENFTRVDQPLEASTRVSAVAV